MSNGRLEKPVYQLPMELVGIEEAVPKNEEKLTSEAALAALSALRVKEKQYIEA